MNKLSLILFLETAIEDAKETQRIFTMEEASWGAGREEMALETIEFLNKNQWTQIPPTEEELKEHKAYWFFDDSGSENGYSELQYLWYGEEYRGNGKYWPKRLLYRDYENNLCRPTATAWYMKAEVPEFPVKDN